MHWKKRLNKGNKKVCNKEEWDVLWWIYKHVWEIDAAKKEQDKATKEEEEQDLDTYMKSLNKKQENKPSVLKMQSDLNKLKKVNNNHVMYNSWYWFILCLS